MALFEFELANVEEILPWETAEGPSLSWFALTDGWFRMPVGDQVLFEYSDEIMAHWGTRKRPAGYQVAAFARDILGSVAAGVARLPERVERLASEWGRLTELWSGANGSDQSETSRDLAYAAWRWLGERSPWASYLTANPNFQFVRIGNELRIHWDNGERMVDGIPVWSARAGVHAMAIESFTAECRDFARRLLGEMAGRLEAIETGTVSGLAPIDVRSLRVQHKTWQAEFASYFKEYEPDVEWRDAERALQLIATTRGLGF